MKVAIINLITRAISGGYRKYIENIVPLFISDKKISDLKIYVPSHISFPNFFQDNIIYKWPHIDPKINFKWLRSQIRYFSPDIIYIPTSRFINLNNLPTIIMVRNMEPLAMPFKDNPFIERLKNYFRYLLTKRACFKAQRIIAVSSYVKNYLINKWKIDQNRIAVIYHGAELPNTNIGVIPKFLKIEDSDNFIFTAGTIRPARGLEDILIAFSLIYKKYNNIKLVIAGHVDNNMYGYKSSLDRKIKNLGIGSNVIWASKVSPGEMAWLYKNCKIFVMTSRVEACPNIALEAMAHGCVCISTESGPMPEIFKDAALYYPPDNSEYLANKITEVLSWDEHKRKEASEKGLRRAKEFSWNICAKKTIEQFEIAIEEFKRKKILLKVNINFF